MSYLYRVTGAFVVDPSVPASLIHGSAYLGSEDHTIYYATEVRDGEKRVVGIMPAHDEPYRAEGIESDLSRAVDELRHAGGRDIQGEMVCVGEEPIDITRIRPGYVSGVRVETAVVRWPDGELVDL